MSETGGGRYGRDVLQSLGFIAIQAALALVNSIVIARVGGPEARGLYGLAVAILAVAWPIAALGQQGSTVYLLGKGRPAGAIAGLNSLLVASLIPLALITGALAWRLGGAAGSTSALAILAAALCVPAAVQFETVRHDYLGRGRVLAYNLCQVVLTSILLILNLWLVVRGTAWVLVALVGAWVGAAALLGLVRGAARPRLRLPGWDLVRESLRYGVREAASRLSEAALTRADVLVLALFVDLPALGVFAIADQIANLMAWLGIAAGRMMFAHAARDGDEARRKLGLISRLLVLYSALAALACVALLGWLVPLIYGEAFARAYVGVLLLLPAVLFKGLHAVLARYLAARGHQRPVVRAGLAALGLDLVLVAGLAPVLGWEAAALAKSLALGVQLLIVRAADRRLDPDAPLRLMPGRADLEALRTWVAARLTTPD